MDKSVTFIGAGNMARALINGLLQQGVEANRLSVICRTPQKHSDLRGRGIEIHPPGSPPQGELVVLATKPQQAGEALARLRGTLDGKVLISVAAGLTTRWLAQMSECQSVIRAMPNTPASIRLGMTGLFANEGTRQRFGYDAEWLFGSVGEWHWLDNESLMDAVTAVAGSGPAYVFLLAEAMTEAASTLGFDRDTAQQMVTQTIFGAAHLLKHSTQSAQTLRQQVTSPGGTTEAAITVLQDGRFEALLKSALMAAEKRGKVLSEQAESQQGAAAS